MNLETILQLDFVIGLDVQMCGIKSNQSKRELWICKNIDKANSWVMLILHLFENLSNLIAGPYF